MAFSVRLKLAIFARPEMVISAWRYHRSNIRNIILFIGNGIIGVIGSDRNSREINEDEIGGRNIIDVSLLWE